MTHPAIDADSETLAIVRRAVRTVVEGTPELKRHPALCRQVANRMVNVSLAAAKLIAAEQKLDRQIAARSHRPKANPQQLEQEQPLARVQQMPSRREAAPPLASAQSASDSHGRSAVRSAAGTVEALKDAVDFPGFVTSLINGVFQSIQSSNIQQLQAFADLLEAVNTSASEFGARQIGPAQAARWAVSRFPGMQVSVENEEVQLSLNDDADMPSRESLKETLEASTEEVDSIDDSDLTTTLIPLVQRKLARDRQSLLSTMIMMGLQRVVVDDGSLHASMRLQVDARSIAERSQLDSVDSRIVTEAGGSFGVGAWGASAKISANVGFVHSDERYSREDIAATAGLRSSVDLRFRSLPLDVTRMANDRTLQQIRSNAMVPDRERELDSLLAQNPTRITQRPIRSNAQTEGQTMLSANQQDERAEEARQEAQRDNQSAGNRSADSSNQATGSNDQGGDGNTQNTASRPNAGNNAAGSTTDRTNTTNTTNSANSTNRTPAAEANPARTAAT